MIAIRILSAALGFLTRLPVNVGIVSPAHHGWVAALFPLVGAVIGAALFGTAALVAPYVSANVTALLVLVVWILITGALHVDGFADLADAFGAAHASRDKRLSVMKDPRVGAHGAVAVSILVLAKWIGITDVLVDPIALIALPVITRGAVIVLIAAFPYARQQGLGRGFNDSLRWHHVVVGLLLSSLVLLANPHMKVVVAGCAAVAVMLALGTYVTRKIGGVTGDVYGAAIESGEIVGLLVWGLYA